MAVLDSLENIFEKKISSLGEKEQTFFRSIKNNIKGLYNNWIKPLLIAVFLFWIFGKVEKALGLQYAIFVQLTIIIILLRQLLSKFS
jgi:hypothetical protein